MLRAIVLAACALLVLPAWAAATTPETLDPLSAPTMGLGPFLSYKMPSFDGTMLHVDVRLPDGEGPFPVLLEFTPYAHLYEEGIAPIQGTGLDEAIGLTYHLVDFYVPRGYAVATGHVRGTGDSDGCLTIGGEVEARDGAAMVEFLAAQPWASGKVAMMGGSYVGTTPIEAATLNPPHLTTILPMSAVTDWYKYYFENGEQRWNRDIPPFSSYTDTLAWIAIGLAPGHRPNDAVPATECHVEFTQNYWLQDDRNAFWEARDHGALAGNISLASVLYSHGWRDLNVGSTMIEDWYEDVQTPKRTWLQNHGHGVPSRYTDYYAYEHRWLDHHLLGRNNGLFEIGPVVVENNLARYRTEAEWPPADATPKRYWLALNDALRESQPAAGVRRFTDVPNPPASPFDSYGILDSLTFDSVALAADAHLAGSALAHLEVTSDRTDTQLTVLVYDVNGTRSTLVTRGHLDARHRDSLAHGQDVVPGQRTTYEWSLHPTDHVFRADHRVRVEVKSSDPYIQTDANGATNQLWLGGSWIELPLVPARQTSATPPRPASWG